MPSVGKIAIVMDDSGYNNRDCDELASIPVPVTISILPQLPFSRQIAECANKQGKEVMLHLPLQPHVVREQYPSAYFITTDLSAAEIAERLNRAIDDIPHLAGINNHEGSKATEDKRVMGTIFKEIQKRDIFFMDSRVTAESVCDELAAKMDIAFTGRDVFLDNTNERGYIEGQFRELAEKAKQRGTAVAIGHTRALTWTILKEQVRKLQAQGYEFVTVNDIIRSQSH